MHRTLGSTLRAPLRWAGRAARAAFGAATHSLSLIPSYLSGLLWLLSQQFLDLATQGYGQNAVVYACLRLLSQSVPEPPLLAYTRDKMGEPGAQLPYDHPLCALIRQPNELLTEYEFFEITTLYCGIGGRAHWWKERDNAGRIKALWPLRTDRVGPIYSDSVLPGLAVISGWSYLIPGTTHYVPLPRADVLTFHFPNPGGESGGLAEGLGPLQVLASEVAADNEATKFVGSMLANYGAPGVVLTVKTPLRSEEDARLIKAAFVREFGGARKGLPGVVDAETDIKPLGFDLSQLEFPNLRRISESRIAAAFGVPAIMAGLLVGLEAGIRATIAEQREYFAETTLANYWRRYSDQFTKDVAAEYGPDIVCRFDLQKVKALGEQQKNEATTVERAFERGTVSVDEYRKAILNYAPLPNAQGKVRILPRGAVEIDEEGNVVGTAPPPTVDTTPPPPGGSAPPPGGAGNGNGKAPAPVPKNKDGQPAGAAGGGGGKRAAHAADGRIAVSAHPAPGAKERVARAYAAWAAEHGAAAHPENNGH